MNFMEEAYKEALKAYKEDEVPIGAVIVRNGRIISKAHNKKEQNKNPLEHAEMICIEKASKKIKDWYLKDCEMYVTLEPCAMCVGALINARIKKIYYGVKSEKSGALGGLFNMMRNKGFNHYFDYELIHNQKCEQILKDYFKQKRLSN